MDITTLRQSIKNLQAADWGTLKDILLDICEQISDKTPDDDPTK